MVTRSLDAKVALPCQEAVLGKVAFKMTPGLPWWRSGWESACQCRRHGFEPWSGKIPHAAEQLGPWATTTEPARLEPVLCNKRGRDSERPAHRDEEWPPVAATRESPRTETKTQHRQKLKNRLIKWPQIPLLSYMWLMGNRHLCSIGSESAADSPLDKETQQWLTLSNVSRVCQILVHWSVGNRVSSFPSGDFSISIALSRGKWKAPLPNNWSYKLEFRKIF